jgi:hypothetical protein
MNGKYLSYELNIFSSIYWQDTEFGLIIGLIEISQFVIIALSLIHAIYNSLQRQIFLVCEVFTSVSWQRHQQCRILSFYMQRLLSSLADGSFTTSHDRNSRKFSTATLNKVKVKVKVILRPTVSRSFCLGVKHPSGPQDQICITVGQLRVCWYLAPSLTRGRVSRLQLLLALAIAVIFTAYEF